MKIGVLAVQGSFSLHRKALKNINVETIEIRLPNHLDGIDGVIIPGGESTTFKIMLDQDGLGDLLKSKFKDGMPAWGTCAGAIMLGKGSEKPQPRWELIDLEVTRNAYGRQLDSFVAPLKLKGIQGEFDGVFIRAPRFLKLGEEVESLAEVDGETVAACQRNILVTSFHPELTQDSRIHRLFIEKFCQSLSKSENFG